ncbi:hypothetical protein Gotur_013995 [Gossypium turneri]
MSGGSLSRTWLSTSSLRSSHELSSCDLIHARSMRAPPRAIRASYLCKHLAFPSMSSADYACRRTFFFRVGFIRSMSMGDLISIHPSELKFPCKFSFASLAFLLF